MTGGDSESGDVVRENESKMNEFAMMIAMEFLRGPVRVD